MSARSDTRLLVVAAVAALAVIAIAVAVAANPTADSSGPAALPERPQTVNVEVAEPLGPTGHGAGGVPVGWRHDRQGAEAAAVAYVESSHLVAKAGPLSRRDVILELATPDYGPSLVETTNRELDDLQFDLGERGLVPSDLLWAEYALSIVADHKSADRSAVRVWSVLVIGAEGGLTARQVWRTSTLVLVWSSGDWKVEHWVTAPGPLPAPLPEADVSKLAEVAEVSSWRQPPRRTS